MGILGVWGFGKWIFDHWIMDADSILLYLSVADQENVTFFKSGFFTDRFTVSVIFCSQIIHKYIIYSKG
jgi:hypothetical protein